MSKRKFFKNKLKFEMKNNETKITWQISFVNHSTEPMEISFFTFDRSQEKNFFPKSNSLQIRNKLMTLRNLDLYDIILSNIVKRIAEHLWSV